MAEKHLSRWLLLYFSAVFMESLVCLFMGLLVVLFKVQIPLLNELQNISSGLIYAASCATLLFSTFYQSKKSFVAFVMSLLIMAGPMLSAPFVFGLLEHVTLYSFITELGNFSFLMNTGNSYKIFYLGMNLLLLAFSIVGILIANFDSQIFYQQKEYNTNRKAILYQTSSTFGFFALAFSFYVIGPFYSLHKSIGLGIDKGNLVSIEKSFVKDDTKVILLPMAHIGDASFYRGIVDDFKDRDAVFLMEGVKDQKGLIKGKLFYGDIAKTIGVAEQSTEFKFPEKNSVKFVWADVDISELSSDTISFINFMSVKKDSTEGVSVENLNKMNQFIREEGRIKNIFNDILNKRNDRLIERLTESLPHSKLIVIAWGAAHMHDIERHLMTLGFHKTLELKRTLTGIGKFLDRKPASI